MPQLAVNMKDNTQNIKNCKLNNNRSKLRHAPYSNRFLDSFFYIK
jgi:hypothetical protein